MYALPRDRKLSRRQLQNTISAMVVDIELMMSNINMVLAEVKELVQQIDTITEKLEMNYENRIKNKNGLLHLDKNSNVCDAMDSETGHPNEKCKINPYHSNDDVFHDMILSFTYNDKYPLWIQTHDWNTKTSLSELSEISTGSDDSNVDCPIDDVSWRDVSNFDLRDFDCGRQADDHVRRFSSCCVNKGDHKPGVEDAYCGVYEAIMEEMLEYPVETIWSDMTSSTEYDRGSSVSISDENFIVYQRSKTFSGEKHT